MRTRKLTKAVAWATALLALAPAGALARGHRRLGSPAPAGAGPTGCRVVLAPEQRTITSESVQLIGQLVFCRGGASAVDQTVTVYDRAVGSPGFGELGTTVTKAGEDGFFTINDPSVKADTSFYAVALGRRSAAVEVKVAPVVEWIVPPTPAENSQLFTGRGHVVKITAKVAPTDRGAEVVLQRESAVGGERWIDIQRHIFVGEGGEISFEHRFLVAGDANVRLVVRPNAPFTVRGLSAPISYQISQTQNPKLTIETPHDSIVSGESTEIHGKLAAGSGRKVTLFSHPRGQRPFTEVSSTTTGSEGAYSFPETPAQNTFYMVKGPGPVHSAVLFQGVRVILTPNTAPSSELQGHPIAFTGTVAPGYRHEPVYLERENQFGGGFHVIGKTELGEEGTARYSIFYEFLVLGKKVLRIRMPGNPANQGAVSAPFDVTVTPGPLPLVKPLPPSALPGEGQV